MGTLAGRMNEFAAVPAVPPAATWKVAEAIIVVLEFPGGTWNRKVEVVEVVLKLACPVMTAIYAPTLDNTQWTSLLKVRRSSASSNGATCPTHS